MSDIKGILVAIDNFVIKHPEIRGHRDFGSLLRDLSVEIDKLTADLARRDDLIKRLVEDAERMANRLGKDLWCCEEHERFLLHVPAKDDHAPDCPITLHRALMKEIDA